MEIRFDKVSYLNKIKNINLNINKSGIYSFLGIDISNNNIIGDILKYNLEYDGNVYYNKKEYKNIKNKNIINKKIGYVDNNPYEKLGKGTVYEEFKNTLINYKYNKDIDKRIDESLKILELDNNILNSNIYDLTLIEAKKVYLTRELLYNPSILILNNITSGLTKRDKSDIYRLLKMLKSKYNKIIIFISKDSDAVNEISDYIYIMNRGKIIKDGDRDILKDRELLDKCGIMYPLIMDFIDKYNKKGRTLYNYRNILDLIKGIYRDIF